MSLSRVSPSLDAGQRPCGTGCANILMDTYNCGEAQPQPAKPSPFCPPARPHGGPARQCPRPRRRRRRKRIRPWACTPTHIKQASKAGGPGGPGPGQALPAFAHAPTHTPICPTPALSRPLYLCLHAGSTPGMRAGNGNGGWGPFVPLSQPTAALEPALCTPAHCLPLPLVACTCPPPPLAAASFAWACSFPLQQWTASCCLPNGMHVPCPPIWLQDPVGGPAPLGRAASRASALSMGRSKTCTVRTYVRIVRCDAVRCGAVRCVPDVRTVQSACSTTRSSA